MFIILNTQEGLVIPSTSELYFILKQIFNVYHFGKEQKKVYCGNLNKFC